MPIKTINFFLEDSAAKWPDKVAVIKGDTKLTYEEIDRQSSFLAKLLVESGIKKGDRVGIFLEKNPDQVVSIFAAVKAGAIFVILNNKLKKDHILHIVRDCRIKGIIARETIYDAVLKSTLEETAVEFLMFADNGKYNLRKLAIKNRIPLTPPPVEHIACIIYTSGSTGMPKGVVISHQNLVDGAEIVSEYLNCKHDDKILSLLPFSFDYGLNQLLTTFMNGATIVLHNFVFPDDVLTILEKEKITGVAGIPTIWISLLNARALRERNYSSLRYLTNSGGKLPVEYVKKMADVFSHAKIFLMYGLTEAFRSTCLPPELVRMKPDSIGQAIPRVKISVLNKEGKECEAGEQGELVHRGALISLGYWDNKDATEARIKELPEGANGKIKGEKGVFSGDLVKRDDEGFMYYIGRNDEMIKSSGFRISPTEVEEVLYKIDGVTGAVVLGKEHPVLGQKIVAIISRKDQSDTAKKEILTHCALNLPDYAVPHEIIFMDDMPKTGPGKFDRSRLKVIYAG